MTAWLVGFAAGPLIGLVVGLAVSWIDPHGYLRQKRRARS